ncbi:MAG: hypothetical protein M3081_19470, partial [Gemmatimonadota bacterium]|nr:hypothetical protein [Gemmatimonadota bacterium]
MKELRRQSGSIGTLLLLASIGIPGVAAAQARGQRVIKPPDDAARFVVIPLRAPDRKSSVEATDVLREKVTEEFDMQRDKFYVLSKQNTCAVLEAAGFACDTAANPTTAKLLAQQLRADEYLEGTLTRTAGGVTLDTRMVLTRNNSLYQPLPKAEGKNYDQAADRVAKSLREARKGLAGYKSCELAINTGKNADAIPAARAAIAAYPNSTLGRLCLAQAILNTKGPSDSIIAITRKVLEIDAKNAPALELIADAFISNKMEDSAVVAMTNLLTANPGDPRTIAKVIDFLGSVKRPEIAIPIIKTALADNPGDPQLIRQYWLILLQAKQYKEATTAGEQLIKTDTAAADSTFFVRLATAYAVDSQPQKAAEAAARGVAKFPRNGSLVALQGRLLRGAGQNQQALELMRRAIGMNPKLDRGWLTIAQLQFDLGQTDSGFVSLKQALANGEDKELVGQTALVEGNKWYKA